MSTVIKDLFGSKQNQVLLKGAPERVLDRCSKIMLQNGTEQQFTDQMKKSTLEKMTEVASQGYRVLGVAVGLDGGNMGHITDQNKN